MNAPISQPSEPKLQNNDKFNFRSKPAQSLQALLQDEFQIKSLEISSHGRTGVIFVETDKGSFVLKANNQGPIDQFFNRMAGLLNLNVAQSICYCCSDLVFHRVVFQIQKYASIQQSFYSRIRSRLNFPFYQIMEYVPSVSLAEVGRDRFQSYLVQENKLYQLGMCMGFDILTNNSDRFRLLWSSDGNINNVLIEVKDHDVFELKKIRDRSNTEITLGDYVFIDHSGFLLDLKNPIAAKNFEAYMKKACDFLVNMIRSLSGQEYPIPKQFQKLKEQIQLYTHYKLTDNDIKKVSSGIIYLINKFLQVFQSRAIEQLYDGLRKSSIPGAKKRQDVENNYWNQYWNDILSKINLNFLQEVFTKMAAIITTYPQIIHKIVSQTEQKMAEHIRKTNFNQLEKKNTAEEEEKQSQLEPGSNPTKDLITSQETLPLQQKQPEPLNQPIPQISQQNLSQIQKKKQEEVQQSSLNVEKQRKWRQKLAKYVSKTSNSPNNKQL